MDSCSSLSTHITEHKRARAIPEHRQTAQTQQRLAPFLFATTGRNAGHRGVSSFATGAQLSPDATERRLGPDTPAAIPPPRRFSSFASSAHAAPADSFAKYLVLEFIPMNAMRLPWLRFTFFCSFHVLLNLCRVRPATPLPIPSHFSPHNSIYPDLLWHLVLPNCVFRTSESAAKGFAHESPTAITGYRHVQRNGPIMDRHPPQTAHTIRIRQIGHWVKYIHLSPPSGFISCTLIYMTCGKNATPPPFSPFFETKNSNG